MSAVSEALLMAVSPASILITNDSLSSKTGGRLFAVRSRAPRRLWISRTTRSVICIWTFFISTRTAPPEATGTGDGRGDSVGGPAATEVPGEGAGDGSGARAGGPGAAADGGGGDAETAADGGGLDPTESAGTGVRAACRKHAPRLISRTRTTVPRRYDTGSSRSINRAKPMCCARC